MAAEARTCPRCLVPHHTECWDYAGDCAIFGCSPATVAQSGDPALFSRLARLSRLWGVAYWVEYGALLGLLASLAAAGWSCVLACRPGAGTPGADFAVFLAAFAVFPAFLALAVLMLYAREALARRMEGPLRAGPRLTSLVAKRQPRTSLAARMVGATGRALFFAAAAAPAAALVVLVSERASLGGEAAIAAVPLVTAVAAWGIQNAVRSRPVELGILDNRFAATTKEAAGRR